MGNEEASATALAAAHETIQRQAEELEHLRRRLKDEKAVEDLRASLSLAGIAGAIASPVSHGELLEMIVRTAAHVISARAGSLFLIDEESEELVFEVAIGPKAQEVRKFRVPLGHGIAGLVAVTGQPMAVSDAERDPRQAADIARSVGYTPQTILCVPLYYRDEVIGVLELLDKQGAPSFTATGRRGDRAVTGPPEPVCAPYGDLHRRARRGANGRPCELDRYGPRGEP